MAYIWYCGGLIGYKMSTNSVVGVIMDDCMKLVTFVLILCKSSSFLFQTMEDDGKTCILM